jgi:hypothetical protein
MMDGQENIKCLYCLVHRKVELNSYNITTVEIRRPDEDHFCLEKEQINVSATPFPVAEETPNPAH